MRWKSHPAYSTMTAVLGWTYCHFFLPHSFLPFPLLFASNYLPAYANLFFIEVNKHFIFQHSQLTNAVLVSVFPVLACVGQISQNVAPVRKFQSSCFEIGRGEERGLSDERISEDIVLCLLTIKEEKQILVLSLSESRTVASQEQQCKFRITCLDIS